MMRNATFKDKISYILHILIIIPFIFFYGCNKSDSSSPTGPDTNSLNGVYEGRWVSGQNGSEGILCIEMNASGQSLQGRFYFIVRGQVDVTGTQNGQQVNWSSSSGWQFTATLSGTHLSGTYTTPTDSGTWEADLSPSATACNWADSTVVNRFQTALSNLRDPQTGQSLASFITQVPLVDVKIDGQTASNWWVCIWEVDDRVNNQKYSVAAAFGRHPEGNRDAGTAWMTQKIHQQDSPLQGNSFYDDNLANGFPSAGNDVYLATSGEYEVDQDSDPNYSRPVLYRSPCENGTQFVVRMTELTGHYQMTGRNITGDRVEVRIPPDGNFSNLGALHIVIRSC